jgi:hypothetical protein
MISHRYLIADTNLEVVHETGTRISLQLSQGQGVVELSDAGMLRSLIKHAILDHRQRNTLQQWYEPLQYLKLEIDITVVGSRVARLDTQQAGDRVSRALGFPHLKIHPIALIFALLKPRPRLRQS